MLKISPAKHSALKNERFTAKQSSTYQTIMVLEAQKYTGIFPTLKTCHFFTLKCNGNGGILA
jgi:hypothetical protein